jgi:hypothetical protein
MEFTLGSARFIDKTEELRRVGINAQVLAARSRRGGVVLGVLVGEISRLTVSTNEVLETLSNSGSGLARTAMSASAGGHRLLHYRSASERGLEFRTRAVLADAYRRQRRELFAQLHDVESGFRRNLDALAELERMTVFIPALISLIRINVAEYRESTEQFLATVEELAQFREFVLDATASMRRALEEALMLLDQLEQME